VEKEKIAEASRNLLAVDKEIEAAAYSRLDAEGKIAATAASRRAKINASGATQFERDDAIKAVDTEEQDAKKEMRQVNAVRLQEQLNSRLMNSLQPIARIEAYHAKNIEQINKQIILTQAERDILIQTADQLRDNQLQKAGHGHSSSEQADRTRNQMMQEFGRGFEDFVVSASMAKTTTEGLAMGLRGAANNVSQMAASFHPMTGMVVAIGASLATVLVPMAIKWVESFHEALEAADDFKKRISQSIKSEGDQVKQQQDIDSIGASGTGKDAEEQRQKALGKLQKELDQKKAETAKAVSIANLADKDLKEEERKQKEFDDRNMVFGKTLHLRRSLGLAKIPEGEDNPARKKEGNTLYEQSSYPERAVDLATSPGSLALRVARTLDAKILGTEAHVADAQAKKDESFKQAGDKQKEQLVIQREMALLEAQQAEIRNAGAAKHLEDLNKQLEKEKEKSEFSFLSRPALENRQKKELEDFDLLNSTITSEEDKKSRDIQRTVMTGRHSVESGKSQLSNFSSEKERKDLYAKADDSSYSGQGVVNAQKKRLEAYLKEEDDHEVLRQKQKLKRSEELAAINTDFEGTEKTPDDIEKQKERIDILNSQEAKTDEEMRTRKQRIILKYEKDELRAAEDQAKDKQKLERSFETKAEREKYEGADKVNEEYLKNRRFIEDMSIQDKTPSEVILIKRDLQEQNDKQRDRKLDADKKMQGLNEQEKTTEEGIDLTKKRMDESGKDTGPTKAFVVGTQDSDKAINRALSGTRTQEDTLKASLKIQTDTLKAIQKEKKALVASV
jgi:hypothetical protein